jgi:predicted nuclease of restriction endonuclease-like (RecB) superfamily
MDIAVGEDGRVSTPAKSGSVEPVGYAELLEQVKAQVRSSRVQAARAVNTELIGLYWQIGALILERQESEGWGSKVIGRLAADLRAEFPGMRGLSQRSLVYMRTFAAAFEAPIAQQAAAQLPWGHVMVLLDKVGDHEARRWYATQAVEYGWSRAVLTHHIATRRHERVGAAPNNFPATLAVGESDLAREIVHDPYDLDFLSLDPGYTERELEDALVARMTHFFTELGDGFAFVGRQYRLPVGDQDFFIDLLFFHLGLRRYIVFELKVGRVEPEHLGKLNFYVNAVDDLLRRPEHGDGSTIGILLAADRDDVVVEYALRGYETPLAVSTYTTHRALPEEVRPALPSPDELAEVIREVNRHRTTNP